MFVTPVLGILFSWSRKGKKKDLIYIFWNYGRIIDFDEFELFYTSLLKKYNNVILPSF